MDLDIHIDFDWDPEKAAENFRKHGVAFEEAATIFLDPFAASLFDEDHSNDEERWITQGRASSGRLLVVSHTFFEIPGVEIRVRLISARPAKRHERKQYEDKA